MTTKDILETLKTLFEIGLPILTFIIGKATKSATNQAKFEANQAKLVECEENLKLCRDQLQAARDILQSHMTLHKGYEPVFTKIDTTLAENNRLLGFVCGVLKIESTKPL